MSSDRDNWYRRTSWTEDDQTAFYARLKRSRGQFNKAQYLRIQAHHLQQLHPDAALELLDYLIAEQPYPSELPSAHLQAAECHVALRHTEQALKHFRKALSAEQSTNGIRTFAFLHFSLFVVSKELSEYYDEVRQILIDHVDRCIFPVHFYHWHLCMAWLDEQLEDHASAAKHAASALDAAGQESSGFRYHPKLGLVTDQQGAIPEWLGSLATEA